MNVYPLLYAGEGNALYDYYGFVENGLVEFCPSIDCAVEKLLQIKNNRPWVRDRSKFYCSTIGTEYEGRSRELAFLKIDEYLAAKK